MIRLAVAALIALAFHSAVEAHELRPGFLEIKQTSAENYDIRFKVPARGDMRLGLYVRLPADCKDTTPGQTERAGAAVLEHRSVQCPEGLACQEHSQMSLCAWSPRAAPYRPHG